MGDVKTFITGDGDQQKTLVAIFLRGGADGLSLVPPLGDDGYYKARPRIALSRTEAIKLDGFYGLNPALQPLEPLYRDGQMAIIQAAGSEDDSRSHFEAQDLMEHAGKTAAGWIGRFLLARPRTIRSPLTAVAIGEKVPESLRGSPAATVMKTFEDFSLGRDSEGLSAALARQYANQDTRVGQAARDTFGAMQRIAELRRTRYRPANGAQYSYDRFAKGMEQIARLIKARVGLEVASIYLDGWDSHAGQSNTIDPLMSWLSGALSAFHRDLGDEMKNTTVVVMTEFGRRLAENGSFGTDHGRASVMFALGGGVKGGRVMGTWPGLKREVLDGPGDLPVTTNYRNVLAPLLEHHSPDVNLRQVFPDFDLKPLELFA